MKESVTRICSNSRIQTFFSSFVKVSITFIKFSYHYVKCRHEKYLQKSFLLETGEDFVKESITCICSNSRIQTFFSSFVKLSIKFSYHYVKCCHEKYSQKSFLLETGEDFVKESITRICSNSRIQTFLALLLNSASPSLNSPTTMSNAVTKSICKSHSCWKLVRIL